MNNFIMIENSVAVESGVPKEFKILPLGLVHSQKGDFFVDNESYSNIRQDFKERQLQIPIDYEHQTLKDVQAPAAGWIQDIILKYDGIYATVDWTEKGAEYLKNREYKYCSPVIMARKSDRRALKLHSVALTNKPAIDAMTPIVNKDASLSGAPAADAPEGDTLPGNGTKLEMLAELLQLPATATLEEIYRAVAALLDNQTALKLKAEAIEFEAHKAEAESAITMALKEGKLAPFQRDWAFRSAMTNFDEFILWLKTTPQVVPTGEMCADNIESRRVASRSAELMGLSHEDIKKYGGQSK